MRIVISGHVDHGKSTIIGRLLADTQSLPEGKLDQIREKCRRNARPFEYAFLLDALKEEQAQGVTIDSARCFFNTRKRNYIIIDAPGHTEFIKNMMSGASQAEAALLVIDALEGVRENSRRHGVYLSLLGIEKICVLINKMDMAGYSEARYREVAGEYSRFLNEIGAQAVSFIPVSGFQGDNVALRSENMPWYTGKTVLETLEALPLGALPTEKPFRMSVQDVYKFTENGDQRRIVAGTPDSGSACAGEEVVFYPSGKRSRIKSIESFGAVRPVRAEAGFASGFTLEEEIYIRRGELACRAQDPAPLMADCVHATVFWFGRDPVRIGNTYHLKTGTTKVSAHVEQINRVWDASDMRFGEKEWIDRNEIADCILSLDRRIAFDATGLYPAAGRFVLVDRCDTVGGGILLEALKKPDRGISAQNGKVTYLERCQAMGQSGLVLWFTGLSGAGKSTIAIELERALMNRSIFSYRLDGDNIRGGLNSDLHFSLEHRMENIRRISEVALLFQDSGMITLVSFISPLRSMRERAKGIIGEEAFVEIYVRASLETCIARDVKGLYAKALDGSVKNFTGVSSPYEEPVCPDLVLDTEREDVGQCVERILEYLEKTNRIKR